jgi:hypothetical protein
MRLLLQQLAVPLLLLLLPWLLLQQQDLQPA